MTRQEIYNAISEEREYQQDRWGDEFDNKNTINDWVAYINAYGARATQMAAPDHAKQKALLQIAAIAVAALEAYKRNGGTFPKRHYD